MIFYDGMSLFAGGGGEGKGGRGRMTTLYMSQYVF